MKLLIKNMVCPRCIIAVRGILASQFKQVTGMTPKEFRALGNEGRTPLDAL